MRRAPLQTERKWTARRVELLLYYCAWLKPADFLKLDVKRVKTRRCDYLLPHLGVIMATMERPRERERSGPSITIALPPTPVRTRRTSSVPSLPPSPLLRARTAINATTGEIVLPVAPTHEPEDDFPAYTTSIRRSPRGGDNMPLPDDQHGLAASSPRLVGLDIESVSDRESLQSGGRLSVQSFRQDIDTDMGDQEEEELLEELADEPDYDLELEHQLNDIVSLVSATQTSAMTALQALLRRMQVSSKTLTTEPESIQEQQTAPPLLDSIEDTLAELPSLNSKPARQEALTKLNSLLDSLASDALVAGSSGSKNDGVSLATALGDLLLSLEKVRPAGDLSSVETARPFQEQSPRPRSNSASASTTASSASGKEDARNPFAESSLQQQQQSDVFASLHRLLTLLHNKTSNQSPSISTRTSFQSVRSDHSSHPFPRRFDSLDVPHSHLRASSSSSLGLAGGSQFSPSSLSLASAPALRLNADPETWSHITHILGLTRDLIASRQSQLNIAGSPLLPRSRLVSTSSSNPECGPTDGGVLAADALTGSLARRSVNSPSPSTAMPKAGILKKPGSMSSLASSSQGNHSLPPCYTEEDGVGATESQVRDYQARGLLPAYVSMDEKSSSSAQRDTSPRAYAEKSMLLRSPTASVESESSARTPSELHAIESSLNRMAPQLADQRVSPVTTHRHRHLRTGSLSAPAATRRSSDRSREPNLQDLIEQLSSSGKRLDDQRVEAPGVRCSAGIGSSPGPADAAAAAAAAADREDEKGAVRGSLKQSALRKFSSAHLAGLRRAASGNIISKGKERSHSPSGGVQPASLAFPSLAESGQSTPTADRLSATTATAASSSKRGGALRSRFFAGELVAPRPSTRSPATPSQALADDAKPDDDLLDLLVTSSTRSRFANQDVALRPAGHRRRYQSGSSLLDSPTWRADAERGGAASEMVERPGAKLMPSMTTAGMSSSVDEPMTVQWSGKVAAASEHAAPGRRSVDHILEPGSVHDSDVSAGPGAQSRPEQKTCNAADFRRGAERTGAHQDGSTVAVTTMTP